MQPSATCPRCARALPANATECPYDGAKLQVFNPAGEDFSWTESTATGRDNSEDTAAVDPTYVRRAPTEEENERADPLVGATLGDYVIGERLGKGAMGIVYAGEQPLIGKKVAIKVLRPEVASDENQVNRLLAEARAVNAIRHRGIIDIFNFGKLPDGRHYVVMELLAGEPLDVMLHRRGPLTPLEVIGMLDEILSALGAGHGAGIIHRDLKPSNIYVVTESNGSKYLKLLDFGLAKHSETQKGGRALTQANLVVGTPEYMAPEQARADGVSAQSDLYSVGIIAFELLTGRLPFEATSPFEFMVHQVQTLPPKPSTFIGGIPAELEALVMLLLEKDPGQRPATTEHVRRELNRIKRSLASSSTLLSDGNTGPRANPKTGPKGVVAADVGAPTTLPADAQVPSIDAPTESLVLPEPPRKGTEKLSPGGLRKKSPWPALALGSFIVCAGAAAMVVWKKHGATEVQPLPDDPPAQLQKPDPVVIAPPVIDKHPDVVAVHDDVPPSTHDDPPPEAKDERPVLVKQPRESGPTRVALLSDISKMEKRAQSSPQKLTVSPSLARTMIARLRTQAQAAKTADQRKRVSDNVREAEKKLFAR